MKQCKISKAKDCIVFRAEMKPAHSHPLGQLGEEKDLYWTEADFLKYLWNEKI